MTGMTILEQSITPDKAASLLEGNTDNRPVSDRRVKTFAQDMRDGKWQFTHQPIAFDENGQLLDGQHRLWAIVESGVTLPMLIAHNCDAETFTVIDTGKPRTQADTLAVAGVKSHSRVPGVMRVVKLYREYPLEKWNNDRGRIRNDEIEAMYHDMGPELLQASVDWARKIRRASGGVGSYPVYGAALYLIAEGTGLTPEEQWHLYWAQYASGASLPERDPRLALRRVITRNYTGKTSARLEEARPQLGVMLKAFNSFMRRRPIQVLSMRDDERLPLVVANKKAD